MEPRFALLINPFYPKDPNASFGKHVLTPSLAMTSFAATTPANWRVEYWDENVLLGRPPCGPMPELVGISVHLTFAERAYQLARWYRQRGAKVVLGDLHVLSWPEECATHADALALGDGVQLWPRILRDQLIKHDLVHAVWRPLVETTRRRHVRYRKTLAADAIETTAAGQVVSAGV